MVELVKHHMFSKETIFIDALCYYLREMPYQGHSDSNGICVYIKKAVLKESGKSYLADLLWGLFPEVLNETHIRLFFGHPKNLYWWSRKNNFIRILFLHHCIIYYRNHPASLAVDEMDEIVFKYAKTLWQGNSIYTR